MFAPLDALLTVGRTRVTRDFSTDERRIYLHESTQRNDEPTRRQ
jgi:hypothetical protein